MLQSSVLIPWSIPGKIPPWIFFAGMCPEHFGRDLSPSRSGAGFDAGIVSPGSLGSFRNQALPGKTAWKILLGKPESRPERIPGFSFTTRSQHIPSFCREKGAAGTSWNHWSKNPGGKWCGKKDTAENIPALRMNPTRGNFLGWEKGPRAASGTSRASHSMGENGWNGITGFCWSPTVLG